MRFTHAGLLLLLAATLTAVQYAAPNRAAANPGPITVCSYDSSRSRAPLTTATGALGYGTLRAALADPANFGPGGTVPASVVLAPPISTATPESLAGCDVFFTSVFTGATPAEAAAIANAVIAGMVLITDANSIAAEQAAVTTLLADLGGGSVGPGLQCGDNPNGGTITGADTQITNGPFGDIRGGTWGTSLSATASLAGGDVSLVTCTNSVRFEIPPGMLGPASGLVMVGGDPSAFDLFTNPASGLHNPNNLTAYLNAIAAINPLAVSKNYRFTDVCLDADLCPGGTSLGTPLPTNANGAYVLKAVVKKNGTVASYNPGQYYAVSTVQVREDVPALFIFEDYGACTSNSLSVLNPRHGGGVVQVVDVGPDGVPHVIANGKSSNVTVTNTLTSVELGPVAGGHDILVYVKFGPGLKGQPFEPLSCTNRNAAATSEGGVRTSATASLVLQKK